MQNVIKPTAACHNMYNTLIKASDSLFFLVLELYIYLLRFCKYSVAICRSKILFGDHFEPLIFGQKFDSH